MLRCSFCGHDMAYIHGHAACVSMECPLHGVNQSECCSGETAACVPVNVVPRSPLAASETPSDGIYRRAG